MLAQDYAFGRDGVKAFKGALKHAKIVHEEYLPANATDFTAGAQRLFDALKDKPGRKIIFILWAGAGNPFKIADLDPKRYGIEIATGGNTLAAMTPLKSLAGMEGATYYYYGIPKNPVNDWLVAEHQKRFGQPPDFFTAGGMSAGIAIVQALNKTQGKSDTDALIKAMEGMSFDTPKGKMTFRPQDHRPCSRCTTSASRTTPRCPGPCRTGARDHADQMDVPVQKRSASPPCSKPKRSRSVSAGTWPSTVSVAASRPAP